MKAAALFMLVVLVLGGTCAVAEPAPDVSFDTLDGSRASLEEYRGQVVLLNLWAVWCSPCLIEIPHLVRLQPELEARGATVIGLAVDSGSASAIQAFWTNRLEIEPVYPLWKGTTEDAARWFGARTYPTTLVIDREGVIRERLLGLQTSDDLRAAVEPFL